MEEDIGRIIGVDFGDSRIGLAISDPLRMMATPLTIITRTEESKDIDTIDDIILQNKVGRIILGLPLSMDGSLGRQAMKVKDFAAELGKSVDIPIEFQDERLSTVAAKNLIREARKTDRKTRYDAAAAALKGSRVEVAIVPGGQQSRSDVGHLVCQEQALHLRVLVGESRDARASGVPMHEVEELIEQNLPPVIVRHPNGARARRVKPLHQVACEAAHGADTDATALELA